MRVRNSLVVLSLAFAVCAADPGAAPRPQRTEPTLEQVLRRMGDYILVYGAAMSAIVADEVYTQRVEAEQGQMFTPRVLRSEFAIVKAPGAVGWTGFRDVVQVNGKPIPDRKERLLRLIDAPSVAVDQLTAIADESARFNIGPISRNFNVPTSALIFLHPDNHRRFEFKHKGTKTIDGERAWEISFKETEKPTIVVTRAGKDVPCEGQVWVNPDDGTIVRTRLRMRNFADEALLKAAETGRGSGQQAPVESPRVAALASSLGSGAPPASGGSGVSTSSGGTASRGSGGSSSGSTGSTGSAGASGGATVAAPSDPTPPRESRAPRREMVRLESLADIDVTYRRDGRLGIWLPVKMSESYEGALPDPTTRGVLFGRATAVAEYGNFKRFQTSVRMTIPK